MSINYYVNSAKTFEQLHKVTEAIREKEGVVFLQGTEVKIGTEVVDVALIKHKILELYNKTIQSPLESQESEYEELALFIFHLKEPKSEDSSVKQVYRSLFVQDPEIKKIRKECSNKLKFYDDQRASRGAVPRSMKIQDCHTVASLLNLLMEMKKSQSEATFHREKKGIPYKEIEVKLCELYDNEMEAFPQYATEIALVACSTIHQIKLMNPRSGKEITGIDVLEKKCIDIIRKDKKQFQVIRQRFNFLAEKINDELFLKHTAHTGVLQQGHVAIDVLEFSFLSKIVGGEQAKYIQFAVQGKYLIRLDIDSNNPEEMTKCCSLFNQAAELLNRDLELIPSSFKHSLRSLCRSYAKPLGVNLSFEQKFGNDPIPLVDVSSTLQKQLIAPSVPEIIRQLNNTIEDVNHSSVQQDSVADTCSAGVFLDEEGIENHARLSAVALFEKLETEKLLEVFCSQLIEFDVELKAPNIGKTSSSWAQTHINEIEKRAHTLVLHLVNERFNTIEKVFEFIKEHNDLIGIKLARDRDLRKAVFGKLDSLIEEQILKEMRPTSLEQHLPGFSDFLSILKVSKTSDKSRAIRKHLEQSFMGVLSSKELRRYLSSVSNSQRILRLACTARKLNKGFIPYRFKLNEQKRLVKSCQRLKKYTRILWEARNNDFNEELVGTNYRGGRDYYKGLFCSFYYELWCENALEVFWNTILENARDHLSLKDAVDVHRYVMETEFRQGAISESEFLIKRVNFFRKVPLKRYIEPQQFDQIIISWMLYNHKKDCMIMTILFLVQSRKKNDISDFFIASGLLANFDKITIQNRFKEMKQLKCLTAEEIAIFETNFEFLPDSKEVETEETPEEIKELKIALEERLNALGFPFDPQTAIMDEKTINEQLEQMEAFEDVEFVEGMKERLNKLREPIIETPEELIIKLENLPQPPTEAPYEVWMELNKRFQSLSQPEIAEKFKQ